jgi:hypothetical protein
LQSVDDNLLGFTETRHTPAKGQKAKEGGKKGELSLHGALAKLSENLT